MPAWLLPAIMAGASIFGGAAKGAAEGRRENNNQASQRNSLLAQLHAIQQGATMNARQGESNEQTDHANIDLNRRRFALAAPSARASQSVRGSILANAQPASISGLPSRINVPQISGGLTPAMFSGETRQLGGELSRQALLDQLRGDEFEPLQRTDFASGVLPSPQLEQYQRSGLLEQILGGLGLGLSAAGGIGGAIQENRGRRSYEPGDEWGYG